MNRDNPSEVSASAVVAASSDDADPGGLTQVETSSTLSTTSSTVEMGLSQAIEAPPTSFLSATDDTPQLGECEVHTRMCAATVVNSVSNAVQEFISGGSDRKEDDVAQSEGGDGGTNVDLTLGCVSMQPPAHATSVAVKNRSHDDNGIAAAVAVPLSCRAASTFLNALGTRQGDSDMFCVATALRSSTTGGAGDTAAPSSTAAAAAAATYEIESSATSRVSSKTAFCTRDNTWHPAAQRRHCRTPYTDTGSPVLGESNPPQSRSASSPCFSMPDPNAETQYRSIRRIPEEPSHETPLLLLGITANHVAAVSLVTVSSMSGDGGSPVSINSRPIVPVPAAGTREMGQPLVYHIAAMSPSRQSIAPQQLLVNLSECRGTPQSYVKTAAESETRRDSGSSHGDILLVSLDMSVTWSTKNMVDDSPSSPATSLSEKWKEPSCSNLRSRTSIQATTATTRATVESPHAPLTGICAPREQVTTARQRSTHILPDAAIMASSNQETFIQTSQGLCTFQELPRSISATYQPPPSPTAPIIMPTMQYLSTSPEAVWCKRLDASRAIPLRQQQSLHKFTWKSGLSLSVNNTVITNDESSRATAHSSLSDSAIPPQQSSMSSDHIRQTLIHGMALGDVSTRLWKAAQDNSTPPLWTSHATSFCDQHPTSECVWSQLGYTHRHGHCGECESGGDQQDLRKVSVQSTETLSLRSATSNAMGIDYGRYHEPMSSSPSSCSTVLLAPRIREAEVLRRLGSSVRTSGGPRSTSRNVELAASPARFSGLQKQQGWLSEMNSARLAGARRAGAAHTPTDARRHRGLRNYGYFLATAGGSLRETSSSSATTSPTLLGSAHHAERSLAVSMQQRGLAQHTFLARAVALGSVLHPNPSASQPALGSAESGSSSAVTSTPPSRTPLGLEGIIFPAGSTTNAVDSSQTCVTARLPMAIADRTEGRPSRGFLSTANRGIAAAAPMGALLEAQPTPPPSTDNTGVLAAQAAVLAHSSELPPSPMPLKAVKVMSGRIPGVSEGKFSAALSVQTTAAVVPSRRFFRPPDVANACMPTQPTTLLASTLTHMPSYSMPGLETAADAELQRAASLSSAVTPWAKCDANDLVMTPGTPHLPGILQVTSTPSARPDNGAGCMPLPVLPLAQEENPAMSTSYELRTPKTISLIPANSAAGDTVIVMYPRQKTPLQRRMSTSASMRSSLDDQHNRGHGTHQIADNHRTRAALTWGPGREQSSSIAYRTDVAGGRGGERFVESRGANGRMCFHKRGVLAGNSYPNRRNGERGRRSNSITGASHRISIPFYQRYRDVETLLDDAERAMNTASVPIISVLGHCGGLPGGDECFFEAIGNRPSLSVLSLETPAWTATITSSDMGRVLTSARGSTSDKPAASHMGTRSSFSASGQRPQVKPRGKH